MEPCTLPEMLRCVLQGFTGVFGLGLTRILPFSMGLLQAITVIELTLLGVWIILGSMDDIKMTMVTMALKVTMYVWMVSQWGLITKLMVKAFVWIGLMASGDIISEADFTDPSALAYWGFSAMALVYNRIFSYTGFDALFNLADIVFTGFAATMVTIAFAIYGIQVFVTLLEFYALSSVIVVLVPFGFIRYTAFLAEKAIAMIWAFGIKLLILAFITGATIPLMVKMSPGMNPKLADVVALAITGWALVSLAWRLPQLAMGLMQGAPQLTAHTVTAAVQNTVMAMQYATSTVLALAGTRPQHPPATQPATQGRTRL